MLLVGLALAVAGDDMSKEELLRHAEPTVGMGFVPPVLARQVCNTLVPPLAPQHQHARDGCP
jgi:hypothetical protein